MMGVEIEKLYEYYYQECLIYALSLSKNRTQAEDLVSDAFFRLLSVVTTLQEEQVKFWLFRVIKNRWIDEGRRQTRWQKWHLLHRQENQTHETPLEALIFSEKNQELLAAIAALNKDEVELVMLFYFLEWPLTDIAQLKELSYNQVKNQLYRIRKRLKGVLESERDGEV